MKIGIGTTRLVLIFSDFVVKIPKIRIFRLLWKAVVLTKKEGGAQEKLDEHVARARGSRFRAIVNFLLEGVRANRREYRYFQSHQNSELVLPVKMLLFGFIEIQQRGTDIDPESPRWKRFERKLNPYWKNVGEIWAHNCCIWNGHLCILDYGNERSIEILEQEGREILRAIRSTH